MTTPPSTEPLSTDDRARCATMARWLAAAAVFGSLGLFASGLGAWLLVDSAQGVSRFAAWGALALLLPERWLALRLRFDRGLFSELAEGRIADLGALDRTLSAMGLRGPAAATRPLDDRVRGTMRLWRRHTAIVAGQVSLAATALLGL